MIYEILKIQLLKRRLKKEKDKKKIGKLGEELVREYLKIKGYKLLEENLRTIFSEVDILCLKDNTLYIVEVKTRKSDKSGTPLESITLRKKEKLKKSAEFLKKKFSVKNFKILVFSVKINEKIKITSEEVDFE